MTRYGTLNAYFMLINFVAIFTRWLQLLLRGLDLSRGRKQFVDGLLMAEEQSDSFFPSAANYMNVGNATKTY